jgi:hypothetical protein
MGWGNMGRQMEGRWRCIKAWVIGVLGPSLEKVMENIWACVDVSVMPVGIKRWV